MVTSIEDLRICYTKTESPVSHFGIMLDVGSREDANCSGIAHIVEHMIFKGSKNMNGFDIFDRIEGLGGDINAYTAKEETCYYIAVMKEYFEETAQVLFEMLSNPEFKEKELVKEKSVIIDEIESYLDQPAERIADEFESMVFETSPLAGNILGTHESVNAATRQQLLDFFSTHYIIPNMVFSYVGSHTIEEVSNVIIKHINKLQKKQKTIYRTNQIVYITSQQQKKLRTSQAHCIYGWKSYDFNTPLSKRFAFSFLANYLAGHGFNSVLNLELREKRGVAYNIEGTFGSFSDNGLFTIYIGTGKNKIKIVDNVINQEIERIINNLLPIEIIKKYKQQLIGYTAIQFENKSSLMTNNAKNLLVFGKLFDFNEIVSYIHSITAEDIQNSAFEIFIPNNKSTLHYV
ncbi:MAG: pitrilysin family protein [Bacteroidales bacterium]